MVRHRKNRWTEAEDKKLFDYVMIHGEGNWNSISKATGLERDGKSCRERWFNYLKPDIKKGPFSKEEEELIVQLHAKHGNNWSHIATQLPGRTENKIKNFWHGMERKKCQKVSMFDKKEENKAKPQLNSTGPSPFTSMMSASHSLNNPFLSSHIGLLDTQENQHFTNPTHTSHYLNHFNPNQKHPLLPNFFPDSVSMPGLSNYCINSHPNVESSLFHLHSGFTSGSTSAFSRGWCMVGSDTITSTDKKGKDTSVHGQGMMNKHVDELMSILSNSSSLEPLPEWNDLSY